MIALLALLLASSSPAGQVLTVQPAESSIRYYVHHKLHDVNAESRQIEGKAVLAPDGTVMAMFRVPVASFDSGDANRDVNMRETLEERRYPFVVFKGKTAVPVPLAAGKTVHAEVEGELDLHGVKRRVTLPVDIAMNDAGAALVKASFHVSLEAHRIDRPSLLLVKLDDDCRVDLSLRMRPATD
jgi:polyisoprenoid-binding protein YceI